MIFASFAVYTCTLDRTTPAKHKRKVAVADNSPRNVASECVNSLKIEFKTEFCVLDSVFLRPQKVESIYKNSFPKTPNRSMKPRFLAMYNAPRLLHNTSDMPISFISESFFAIVSSRPKHSSRNFNTDVKALVFEPYKLPFVGKKRNKNKLAFFKSIGKLCLSHSCTGGFFHRRCEFWKSYFVITVDFVVVNNTSRRIEFVKNISAQGIDN